MPLPLIGGIQAVGFSEDDVRNRLFGRRLGEKTWRKYIMRVDLSLIEID
jgi:hypothetical protein